MFSRGGGKDRTGPGRIPSDRKKNLDGVGERGGIPRKKPIGRAPREGLPPGGGEGGENRARVLWDKGGERD